MARYRVVKTKALYEKRPSFKVEKLIERRERVDESGLNVFLQFLGLKKPTYKIVNEWSLLGRRGPFMLEPHTFKSEEKALAYITELIELENYQPIEVTDLNKKANEQTRTCSG